MDISGCCGRKIRFPAVAGTFYPAGKEELTQELKSYYKEAESMVKPLEDAQTAIKGSHTTLDGAPTAAKGTPAALIAPHAGYVFSGAVAATAFSRIPQDAAFDRIILIGPSHCVGFDGAAVDVLNSAWQTPLGEVQIDEEFAKQLSKKSPFKNRPDAFPNEHGLEVQLPFLQFHLKKMPPIVPIILGTTNYNVLKVVAECLKPTLEEGKTLFVISSDFSHYPNYEGAKEADLRCAEAISTGRLYEFANALEDNDAARIKGLATSACGQAAIAVLLEMTGGDASYAYEHLVYRNSGDSPYGDLDRVVGYSAFAVYKTSEEYSLSHEEMETLLEIARASIEGKFEGRRLSDAYDGKNLSPKLRAGGGAFVTLNKGNRLRGCIGHFGEDYPVYQMVAQMARAAAFEDPRFGALRESELGEISIEISVLSPLKRIASADEFVLGRDGIYIVKGYNSGTFLPQVADDTGWSKEEFLGHCSRDKAGLGWDGWKTADLYTYQAVVFSED
ncbi:MAG TPA: AmmeMemoRadiSam system protein B [Candidatus Cryptobacteroides sp.]|nr:AmmeMemoRadiSam system protein B [Candidatus Cryptobacteroides sp.]